MERREEVKEAERGCKTYSYRLCARGNSEKGIDREEGIATKRRGKKGEEKELQRNERRRGEQREERVVVQRQGKEERRGIRAMKDKERIGEVGNREMLGGCREWDEEGDFGSGAEVLDGDRGRGGE